MKPTDFRERFLNVNEFLLGGSGEKVLVLLKDIVFVLGFAFLTAVSAKLRLEIGPVPITGQTLVVLLSGAFLGSGKGAASQITYLLAGIFGFDWFARGGGPQYLFSPTFGYLIGFVAASYAIGYLMEKGWNKNPVLIFAALLVGNCLIYLAGLPWLSNFIGPKKALTLGLYPFLAGDFLKLLAAFILVLTLKRKKQNWTVK